MIKTIAFDMNGVLIHETNIDVQKEIAKKFKIKKKNWINLIRPIIKLSSQGKIKKERAVKKIKNTLKEKEEKIKKSLDEFYKLSYKFNKPVINISKELKKRGYKIIIISNLGHFAKDFLVENKRMKYFDDKIISCEVKSSKPDKKIYRTALKKSNTKPKEMIFIDNSEKNIAAAKKIGINGVLFKDSKQLLKNLKKLGVEIK